MEETSKKPGRPAAMINVRNTTPTTVRVNLSDYKANKRRFVTFVAKDVTLDEDLGPGVVKIPKAVWESLTAEGGKLYGRKQAGELVAN